MSSDPLTPLTLPCSVLAGYRLVVPSPCACLHSICVQNLSAAHSSAVVWRLVVCVFWPFMWAFFCFPAPFKSWTLSDDGLYISLAHFLFSLLLVTLNCYSCRNNLILLDLFLGQPFIPFLSGLSWALFCFYSWALMSLWASMARLFSLGFHGPFTNSTLPWTFY